MKIFLRVRYNDIFGEEKKISLKGNCMFESEMVNNMSEIVFEWYVFKSC